MAAGFMGNLVGCTLAHFHIDAELGRGGMGVVYLATDAKLRRRVALKVLPEGFAASEERRRRFLREAQAAAAVSHANIATVYEVGEADAYVFIAMELVDGETLRDKIESGLSIAASVRIAKDIARGLERAHEKRIAHRDLKPENIMITRRDETKILDFGLAKVREDAATLTSGTGASALGRAETEPHMTKEGQVLGTPAYMSPEQAAGEPADARTDVFSFGILFFEMLTGVRPFEGATAGAMMLAASRDVPKRASRLNPGVSPEIDRIVERCLAKPQDARFANGGELLLALDALDEPPKSGVSGSTSTPERAPAGRGRTGLYVIGLSVFVATGALVGRARLGTNREAAGVASPASSPSAVVASVSTNAEAARVYAEATETWRTDSDMNGIAGWERSLELDPDLCAAHLRLALNDNYGNGRPKEEAERAARCADRLEPRDRALLELLPLMLAEKTDHDTLLAGLARAAQTFPESAEIAYLAASYELDRNHWADAIRWADRSLADDPQFVHAYITKDRALIQLGHRDEARAVLRTCLDAARGSTLCGSHLLVASDAAGDCRESEAVARRHIHDRPGDSAGYTWLGSVLPKLGAEREAVEEAYAQAAARETAPNSSMGVNQKHEQGIAITMSYADFAGAERELEAMDRALTSQTDAAPRWSVAARRARILLEEGKPDAARVVVRDAARRRVALVSHEDDAPLPSGARPDVYDILSLEARVGIRPLPDYRAAAARAEAAHPIADAFTRWTFLHVWEDPSPKEARAAVLAAPSAEVLDAAQFHGIETDYELATPAGIGRTLLRGGRPDAAIPWLWLVARLCTCANLEHMHAWLDLGDARAQTGDNAGARAAYEEILRHWGDAKPRSVTEDAARQRLAALGVHP